MTDSANQSKNDEKPKNLSEFIFKFLDERVSDPLWRSYIFFFLIYNWRAFATFVFGDFKNPSGRIDRISDFFYDNKIPDFISIFFKKCDGIKECNFTIDGNAFWIVPFICSLIYIFGYLRFIKPKIVEIYSKNNGLSLESVKKELKDKQDKINKLTKEKDDIIKEKDYEKNILIEYWKEKDNANTIYLNYIGMKRDDDYYIVSKGNLQLADPKIGNNLQWNNKNYEIIHIFYDKLNSIEMAFLVKK